MNLGLLKTLNKFASKMSNFASVAKHPPSTDLWQKGNGKIDKTDIKISAWNINGYRSIIKKGQLVQFLSRESPDFLCLSETKVDLQAFKKQKLGQKEEVQSYSQYWNFCKVSSGYSGVLILSKYQPIQIVEDFPFSTRHSLEGRVLTLEFQKFYLVGAYQPNAGRGLDRLDYKQDEFNPVFREHISNLQLLKPVIIAGDLNVAHKDIDLTNPKANKNNAGFTLKERNSFAKLLSMNFSDTYRQLHPNKIQYTWWSNFNQARQKNIGWRIDYVLMDKRLSLIESIIHDKVLGSDHCPVSSTISIISV